MDYNVLLTEIALPQYAGLEDAVIATALNAAGVESYQPVPVPVLTSAAYSIGLPVRLRVAVRTPETPVELAAVCEALLDLLQAPFPTVDFYAADGTPDPATGQLLAILQKAGLLSEAEAATLAGLAVVPGVSRAQALGLGTVTAADVTAARAWQATQVAEAARLDEYAALRQRLVSAGGALAWLQMQQDAGAAAPEWVDVVERL